MKLINSVALWGALACSSVAIAAPTPLLQDGKQTLYQRVLTTPGCALASAPDRDGEPQPAFSRFYVYDRVQKGQDTWLQVGPDSVNPPIGWIKARCTVDWKMQLTLAFTNPAGRDPVLFFKDQKTLEHLLESPSPEKSLSPMLKALVQHKSVPDVVAREPENMVDQHKQFYLLPVLEANEVMTDAGFRVRMLNVASVSENTPHANDARSRQDALKEFSASVVFVIDSTISMGPYIDRTKEAIAKIYKHIEQEKLLDKVKFGLVAFRSNTKAVPGLEYDKRLFVDPGTVRDGKDFLDKVSTLAQAKVSSSRVEEDAFGGVMTALDQVDWTRYGARYVVLITDAGALSGSDPLSSTHMDAEQVRQEAAYRGVALYTLHLKAEAKTRQTAAENQYRVLSLNPFLHKPLYYPVPAGDMSHFGQVVDGLSGALTEQIRTAYHGKPTAGSALGASREYDKQIGSLTQDTALLGHAMRLAYLGDRERTQAPPVFKAWISDRDLVKQQLPSTEVKVLLTKSELSDMAEMVGKVADAANEGMISPDDMFARLRSLAATLGNDPHQLKQKSATQLGQMGLLGEYIEGLPYLSDVLGLDEETWKSWDGVEQERFIRRLNTKLHYYQRYNQDVDRWVSLAPHSDPRDHVYPVPLDMLP